MNIYTQYVSYLRGLYLYYHNCHFITSGGSFYGDHLLFERLYQTAQENSDQAAEKIVGLFGKEHLNLQDQLKVITDFTSQFSEEKDLCKAGVAAEKAFLKFSEEFYAHLEKENKLSLGLDDLIMSIANKREEAIYLLNQKDDTVNKVANKFKSQLAR